MVFPAATSPSWPAAHRPRWLVTSGRPGSHLGLGTAHEKEAAAKTTRVIYQGLDPGMKELIAAVQETDRYPSTLPTYQSGPWRPDRCSEAHAGTLRYRDGVPGRRAGQVARQESPRRSPRRRPQDLAGTLNRTAKHHPSTAGGRERDAKQKLQHELVPRLKANGRMFR